MGQRLGVPGKSLAGRDVVRGPNSTRKHPGEKALPAVRLGNCQQGAGETPWALVREQVSGKGS